jgi:hypothetical protein
MEEVIPEVHHLFCAKHIERNMRANKIMDANLYFQSYFHIFN